MNCPVLKQSFQQTVDRWEMNLSGVDENRLVGPRGDWWWTGAKPKDLSKTKLHSLPQLTLESVNEAGVKSYFDNTWTLTEVLFSSLKGEEAFYRPPYHDLRHPMMFYYGHTASFYVNKLYVAGLLQQPINPYFESIFETGVDEMSWDDLSKNYMKWPTVSEVHAYRKQVYEAVQQVISENISSLGETKVTPDHPLWALFMAFEHDRIHLETSSVLLRELPLNLLQRPESWVDIHESAFSTMNVSESPDAGVHFPVNELQPCSRGETVSIGKLKSFPTFGWDNEYGQRSVPVPDFQSSKFMVSNGEFYEFVAQGGYQNEKYWTADGWGWKRFRNAKSPFFWGQAGPQGRHQYKLRTLFELVDMPWSWPVNVNKHEATAFCNFKAEKESNLKGLRVITEAEHILLREKVHRPPVASVSCDPSLVHGGSTISKEAGVNLNLAFGSETPVDFHPPNSNGFHDVTGNAWEWTEDHFNPLPGFEVHQYYDDFSTPCFDGEHNMIVGGSFMSSGDAGANLHCRYHFRPHFLQHSGFRYVKPGSTETFPGERSASRMNSDGSVAEPLRAKSLGSEIYESDGLVNQYLALHYGQHPEVVDQTVRQHSHRPDAALDFPKRCADLLESLARDQPGNNLSSALDIGCAVGGSSFHLANSFSRVTGIDFSTAFVNAAIRIRDSNKDVKFSVPVEGTQVRSNITVKNPAGRNRDGVSFQVGDACNLASTAALKGPFDGILMANLLCRLPDARLCLNQLDRLLNKNGVILTVSPFSWLPEYTNQEKWLQQGDVCGQDALEEIMKSNGFKMIFKEDMPLLIREHERKYQYIVSSGAAFVRK